MLKRWCSEHNIKWFIMLLLTDIDMQLALLWFLIVSQYRHQCCYCSKIQYWPCCHMPNFYLRARPFRHLPYYWICVCIGNANIMLLSSPKFVPASPPWKLARSAWNFNTMCKMVSIHIAAFCLLIWPRSKNYSRFSIPARHPMRDIDQPHNNCYDGQYISLRRWHVLHAAGAPMSFFLQKL